LNPTNEKESDSNEKKNQYDFTNQFKNTGIFKNSSTHTHTNK